MERLLDDGFADVSWPPEGSACLPRAGLIGLAAFGTAPPTSADTSIFDTRNLSPHIIGLRFHSKTRYVWKMRSRTPAGEALDCREGEQICCGATSGGLGRGVGSDKTQDCKGCGYICRDDGTSRTIDRDGRRSILFTPRGDRSS